MAIKLVKVLDNGFEAEYWRILNVQADADTKMLSGMVALYKDKDARKDGKLPVNNMLFHFKVESITGNLLSLVYDHLKQTQLTGGEDE